MSVVGLRRGFSEGVSDPGHFHFLVQMKKKERKEKKVSDLRNQQCRTFSFPGTNSQKSVPKLVQTKIYKSDKL